MAVLLLGGSMIGVDYIVTESEIAKLIAENFSPLMATGEVILSIAKWSIGIVVTAVIGAVVVVYKLSEYKTNLQNDIQIMKVDLSSVTKKVSHIDSHLVRVDAQVSDSPPYQSFTMFTQASSPLTLTSSGEEMVRDSGFFDVLDSNLGIFEGIIANAEGRPDRESFVEKEAFQKVENLFEENNVIVSGVSQFMYENGMRQSKATYNGAIRAFAVAARDSMFRRMDIEPPVPKQKQSSEV